jgi:hypothetical protein
MAPAPFTAREIHLDHIGWLDQRLDHPAGCDEHAVGAEARREVTVPAGDQPTLGELAAA